jgi:phosphoenolpyruvate synthase/pyruvate phosphate dikinase
MSPYTLSLPEIKSEDHPRVGGKGFALAVMARGGFESTTVKSEFAW